MYRETNTPIPMNAVAHSARIRGFLACRTIARNSLPGRSFAFGVKLRCAGSRIAVAIASASAVTLLAASAHRHDVTASSPVGINLPVSPPIVLPEMYKPIAPGRSLASSSSESQVIATAGVPAIATPCRARSSTSCSIDCASGNNNPMPVATSADTISTRPRPYFSESIDAGTTHSANPPVAADTVSAVVDGEASNASARVGSSAWVA